MEVERKHVLADQLHKFEQDFDRVLSQDELFDILDKQSGVQFDRTIGQQLYQQCIKNGELTINTFIAVYIQAESILIDKINQGRQELKNCLISKSECIKTLAKLQNEEVLNEFFIMDSSYFTITQIKTQINRLNMQLQLFLVINCGTNSYQSSVNNEQIWEETFEFPIQNGKELIDIHVKANSGQGNIDVGECQLQISEFRLQEQQEIQVKLNCNKPFSGSLIVQGLWIYSKTKYFADVIHKMEQGIIALKDDLNDFEQDLEILQKAFQQSIVDNISSIPPIFMQSPFKTETTTDQWELANLNKYIAATFTFTIALCSLNRCCFLDILIILVYSQKYYEASLNSKLLKCIAFASFASFVLDILWIIIFMLPLCSLFGQILTLLKLALINQLSS